MSRRSEHRRCSGEKNGHHALAACHHRATLALAPFVMISGASPEGATPSRRADISSSPLAQVAAVATRKRQLPGRAQTELMGLAFVVVIIVIALLFYLTLSTSNSTRPASSVVRLHAAYGTQMLSAMLETTVPKCGYPLAQALQTCAKNANNLNLNCGVDGGVHVCVAAHDAIDEMLATTIGDRMKYAAYVRKSDGSVFGVTVLSDDEFSFIPDETVCDDGDDKDVYAAPRQPISIGSGQTLDLELVLCS